MKKIYSIILSIVALFAATNTISAQEPGPYSIAKQITDPKTGNPPVFPEETNRPVYVDTDNKIAFTKNISTPFKDGTYWLKLESFATGSASYQMSAEPADIVLVLDFSGSMTSNNVSSGNYYVPVNGSNEGGYAYSNSFWTATSATGQRFFQIGKKYYQVKRDRKASGNTFVNPQGRTVDEYYNYLYIDTDNGRYYLDDMSLVRDMPTKYTNRDNNAPIWKGSLLRYYNTAISRLNALKAAVYNFIEVIYHNDNYEDDGFDKPRGTPLKNRISIVTYSSAAATSILLDGWTYVSTETGERNVEALIKAFVSTGTQNQTHADTGMQKANTLLNEIKTDENQTRWNNASRTVVMFTDGAPGESLNWSDPTSTNVADGCIREAKEAKTTYEATVFSVLVGSASGKMPTYMNAVSSNYPEATALDNLGKVCTDGEYYSGEKLYLYNKTADFYKNADADLSGVFEEIARQSGGDSNTRLTAATSTVDIVSDSFVLPDGVFVEGADIKNFVKVFTARLDKIENGEYVFKEEILAPYSTDTYDEYENGALKRENVDVDGTLDAPTISVILEGKNKIKVTGFDYANNWCGPVKDEDDHLIGHQGHKIIIMIPIKMNPDAVGGPDVSTNIVGSGIILPGQQNPLVQFESPTVSLPVNLYIKKIGLKPGESAKFKIERAEIPLEGSWSLDDIKDEDWKYVTSVFVTQPEGANPANEPMVKVRGMASVGKNKNNEEVGFVYKITEEDWSWSYQRDKTPQYTVTSKVSNPFSFSNSKITELEYKLRHAESKATNVFKKEGGEERYDDSKKNVRGSSETENPGN